MKTYFRILSYVKPYKKYLGGSIFFTILYALMNGASIYLTIPLLDTLFKQSDSEKNTASEVVEKSSSLLPNWLSNAIDAVKSGLQEFVFTGDTTEILIRVCILILIAFL